MKPTDRYIEWLKEHPTIWEALQEEWNPSEGDRFSLGDYLGLVTHPWSEDRSKWGGAMWIPALGHLMRMLAWKGVEWTGPEQYPVLRGHVAGLWKATLAYDPELGSGRGVEPEIACTALWAKVRIE